MMKRFLQLLLHHSKDTIAEKLFIKNVHPLRIQEVLHNLKSNCGFSTVSRNVKENANNVNTVFANFTIYKTKASLSIAPILPTFKKDESGKAYHMEKPGVILLSFCPAVPGQQHKYNWEKKQHFALSVIEVGSLISLGPNESCELVHDLSMNTSLVREERKSLSISSNPDHDAFLISLNVADQTKKIIERLDLPVTKAEFTVMRTAFSYVLPYIMGWDRLASPNPKTYDQGIQRQILDGDW